MSVLGKGLHEWEAQTICDFGDSCRKQVIRVHYSLGAAQRAYRKLLKLYGKEGRLWQETKHGTVINDNSEASNG